jgi:predicted Kef-type K+ transport protein
MEALQALANQLHFSLSVSQMIISFGILALGAMLSRMKVGLLLFMGTLVYWEYAANKTVLFQMALANSYGIFLTVLIGLLTGFLLVCSLARSSTK